MALVTDERFEKLNLPQLRALAKTFKVNLNGKTKKSEIIDDLLTSGVTWDMYEALSTVPDEPKPVEEPVVEEPVDAAPVAPARELDEIELALGEDFSDLDEPEEHDNAVEPHEPVSTTEQSETVPAQEEESEVEYTLVKMTRENRIFERYGYRFTREAPYMLVDENSADKLIEIIGGFRRASSREVKEFYGG